MGVGKSGVLNVIQTTGSTLESKNYNTWKLHTVRLNHVDYLLDLKSGRAFVDSGEDSWPSIAGVCSSGIKSCKFLMLRLC